jgi:hypothetical protein
VCSCVVERKGSIYEGNIVAVKELVGYVRRQIRDSRKFGIGGGVYAVLCNHQHQYMRRRRIAGMGPHQDDLAVLRVAEGPPVYSQPHGRHDLGNLGAKRACERRGRASGLDAIYTLEFWAAFASSCRVRLTRQGFALAPPERASEW